ncbi:MAG: VRR-NUC domain-containing protein [Rubrobacteraceae bacterium]|nr:VRR-NUC domain-containing protein [Rubrobacteraceae bacterium]
MSKNRVSTRLEREDCLRELDFAISEKNFTTRVKGIFRAAGWLTYHTWNSKHSDPGFPDLMLVRDGRLVAMELKVKNNKISECQARWLEALARAGIETYVMWPRHEAEITKIAAGESSAREGKLEK